MVLIVGCSIVLSATWTVRVPFFQQPDEIAHADYAFAFFDAGQPFWLSHSVADNYVTKQVRYLLRAADYRRMRYDVRAAVHPEYFGASWRKNVDSFAPKRTLTTPRDGSRLPYVMLSYPPLYYIVVAAAMAAASAITHGSLVATFLAGRCVSIVFSIATLLIAGSILSEMRFNRAQRACILTTLAVLPLSTAISSSIQPDVASAFLVDAAWLAVLRLKLRPTSTGTLLGVSLCIVLLAFTKLHYAAIALVAIALALRPLVPRIGLSRFVAFVVAVPAIAIAASRYSLPGGSSVTPDSAISNNGRGTALDAIRRLFEVLRDTFGGGVTFDSFWFHFGIRNGEVFSHPFIDVFAPLLIGCTLAVLVIIIAGEASRLRRIATLARNGQLRVLRFVCSDLAVNVTVLLTGTLVALYISTGGFLVLQGRYWYPTLLALVVVSVRAVSQSARGRLRSRITTGACAAWAAYAAIAAPSALHALDVHYYVGNPSPKHSDLGGIGAMSTNGRALSLENEPEVGATATLVISGIAIDSSVGLPAHDVRYSIDGAPLRAARVGLPSPEAAHIFNDPELGTSTFRIAIAVAALHGGAHSVRVVEFERGIAQALDITSFNFRVRESGRDVQRTSYKSVAKRSLG